MIRLKKTMEELNRITSDEYKKQQKNSVIVILDNVRSAHNVGSIFRTCDAFLVEKMYLCGITPTPPNAEIHKTALGATEHVEWIYQPETSVVMNSLKESGYKIFSVEQTHNSVLLPEINIRGISKAALIFGNEVYGIGQEIINISDCCIEIPQMGTKHSLNVSVCAGIVIYHFTIHKKG